MPEAAYKQNGNAIDFTPTAAVLAGEVIHLPDGRAGVAITDVAAGELGAFQVSGIVEVLKTLTMVMLKGSRVFWDHSASKAHLLFGANTADYYLGVVQETAASAATTVKVALNVEPHYTLALRDGFTAVPIPAITANPQGMMFAHGNGVSMVFDTAAEAEKFDALSTRGIAVGTPGILHALINIVENGDASAFDLNVGMANASHATDADSITESLFVHIDGASLNINLESDDGTTEVAATDSTVDAVVGTPFLVQFDLTDDEDIQVYINGVNVLPSSVFKLNAATGPLKLLAHMEKSANDSPGSVTVMDLGFTSFDV
jgi:predicted RecA/RadA family phage recombinase